jgi:PIN domain nuclease of toxin-antitoxin system
VAATDLAWDHRDPADRLIVATAEDLALPLITRDRIIQGFYGRCRW